MSPAWLVAWALLGQAPEQGARSEAEPESAGAAQGARSEDAVQGARSEDAAQGARSEDAAQGARSEDGPVEQVVRASARAIDRCVAGYLVEKPGAVGTARVVAVYGRTGEVERAHVRTELREPRNLLVCLRRVARNWGLPRLATGEARLEVTVAVYPGARFELDTPARNRSASRKPPEGPPRPLGAFTFQPGGFWNGGWSAQGIGVSSEGDADRGVVEDVEDGPELAGEPPEAGPGTGVSE